MEDWHRVEEVWKGKRQREREREKESVRKGENDIEQKIQREEDWQRMEKMWKGKEEKKRESVRKGKMIQKIKRREDTFLCKEKFRALCLKGKFDSLKMSNLLLLFIIY